MRQYGYRDIVEFLFDDGFYCWAKYGISKDGFDIGKFMERHQGQEKEAEFAAALIRSLEVAAARPETSEEYKRESCAALLLKVKKPEKRISAFRLTRGLFVRAACVLALLFAGVGAYFHYSLQEKEEPLLAHADIDSLKNSGNVRIMVSDRTVLEVEDEVAEIKVEKDGSLVVDNRKVAEVRQSSKHEKLRVSRVVVPYGKRSRMILPDSSCVWINSGSCISYRSDFLTDRELEVQGEVFLDVRKDDRHPFRVKSGRLEVCVFGTAFNVTDYEDDPCSAVVLVRGSVNVKAGQEAARRLQPGQRLSVEKDQVEIREVDVYSYVCWKDNRMNFTDRPLKEIIRSLSRYYNVRIEVSGECVEERCSGSLDLEAPFPEVLETISQVVPFYTERKDNVIYLFTYKD